MLRLFTGFDAREADGWLVFIKSLLESCPSPVSVIPLSGMQIGGATNTFTLVRFLIPEYCNWGGVAIWLDGSDMLLRANILELASLADTSKAVQVVRHSYKTKHRKKYVGTAMEADNEDYERKNWSSAVIWNCGHMAHFRARDEIRIAVAKGNGSYLHRFEWLKDGEIGDLPIEWNWMPQEYGENRAAKLIHYTVGIPGFKHYANDPMSKHWHDTAKTWQSER